MAAYYLVLPVFLIDLILCSAWRTWALPLLCTVFGLTYVSASITTTPLRQHSQAATCNQQGTTAVAARSKPLYHSSRSKGATAAKPKPRLPDSYSFGAPTMACMHCCLRAAVGITHRYSRQLIVIWVSCIGEWFFQMFCNLFYIFAINTYVLPRLVDSWLMIIPFT